MIIVVIELLVTIYVAVQRYGLEFRVADWLREDFFKNITGEEVEHKQLWDQLQSSYECCGLNGPEDYHALRKPVSISCCAKAFRARNDFAKQMLYRSCLESASYFSDGCEDEILEVLRSDAEWLFGVAITSFWFEAAGMLLAMWVANNERCKIEVYTHTVRY
ncbi:tetraspanin-9-like [Zerene cesonia]|uniref:tetraspanin-9-like n=1 Tax=Zerene cesonia TaxID=33412 RepID=UPI0018E4E48C|nr:tetraspanin-9-like [Zerene cesonia]